MSRVAFWMFMTGFFFCLTVVQTIGLAIQQTKGQAHQESQEISIERQGSWRFTPDVYVCPSSVYSVQRVDEAVEYWTNLGHKFGEVQLSDCKDKSMLGVFLSGDEVMYALDQSYFIDGEEVLGLTFWMSTHEGSIAQAHINIPIRYHMVLEHELGHALGFLHIENDPKHLMHPSVFRPKLSVEGLER